MEKEKLEILKVIFRNLEEVETQLFNFQMNIEGNDQKFLKRLAVTLYQVSDELDVFIDFNESE